MALRLECVSELTSEVTALWGEIINESAGVRGAATVLEGLGDLASLCARGALWLGSEEVGVSLCVLDDAIIKILYVTPARRGRGVGRATLSLLRDAAAPLDAWALPGDRASKSLYESIGWRARLLTMRGD